jgi:hypothetical protein
VGCRMSNVSNASCDLFYTRTFNYKFLVHSVQQKYFKNDRARRVIMTLRSISTFVVYVNNLMTPRVLLTVQHRNDFGLTVKHIVYEKPNLDVFGPTVHVSCSLRCH